MTVNVAGRGRRRRSAATAATEPGSKPASRTRGRGAVAEGAEPGVAGEAVDSAEPVSLDPAPAAEPVSLDPAPAAAPVSLDPAPAAAPVSLDPAPAAAPLGPVAKLASAAARQAVVAAMPAPAPEPPPAAVSPPVAVPAPVAAPVASSIPEVPKEAPAVLHPSDRRGYTPPPPPRPSVVPSHHHLAIGELDQTLFDCPSCRRPLALGTRRCPGCGIRLIRSIPLAKAVTFVVVGVLAGAIVGVGGSVLAGGLGAGAAGPIAPAGQSPAGASAGTGGSPTPTFAATADPSLGPEPVEPIPTGARAALAQALEMNARLGTADAELRAILAAKVFDATAAAQTMRTISADMVFAEDVATRTSGWTGSAEIGAQLVTFYSSVHDTAGTALLNSVRNAGAYRTATRSMVQLLAQRTALDKAIRATAAAAGVSLPEPSTTP
jgi:hypothetical protein